MLEEGNENKFRTLFPSFANPKTWRTNEQVKTLSRNEWQQLRLSILQRDGFTCQYCGYKSEKYQIVHHIDGNPENNADANLITICQMCNLVEHSGQGCVVQGIVDLYKESKYSQNDIIRITRKMRDEGKSDVEIIEFLGLKKPMPFLMEREYLSKLYGFVTSRSSISGDGMYDKWKAYHSKSLSS